MNMNGLYEIYIKVQSLLVSFFLIEFWGHYAYLEDSYSLLQVWSLDHQCVYLPFCMLLSDFRLRIREIMQNIYFVVPDPPRETLDNH